MGKKRKYELDLEVERTMYGSFATAANAISQLYTQAVQQQKRAAVAASRSTLVRVSRLGMLVGASVPVAGLLLIEGPCESAGKGRELCVKGKRRQ